MFRNYLKVALRYLARHKGYTFINVLGLSVGIACCILVMQFVKSEWSWDRFHSKSDRIYRAWLQEHYQGEIFNNISTPVPLAPVLQSGLPEVEAACRIGEIGAMVQHNNDKLNGSITIVDSTFFKVFDFKLKEGDISNPFPTAHSVILAAREAKRIFGNDDPVGKDLQLEVADSMISFTVSGVAADPPVESSIQFEMLIPFTNAHYIWSEKARTSGWSYVVVQSFFLLREGTSMSALNQKIDATMQPLVAKNYKAGEYNIRLQPLKDIYFNTTLPQEVARTSDPKYSYILATIGVLILLIACINFVTLSVGRSVTRALEVGVRKVLGAERRQLIWQFWSEALLFTLVSVAIGIGLTLLLQKSFNQLANRELSLTINAFTVGFFAALVCMIALVAGMYPSFVLSGFKPIQVLKGKLRMDGIGFFRKALVVGQFVASIVMIIATVSVIKQHDLLLTKDLGFNKDHVVIVPTGLNINEGRSFAKKFQAEIEKNPDFISSTASIFAMHNYGWMTMGYTDDKKVFRQFQFNAVDEDFVPAMDLLIVKGRNFKKNDPSDSNYILVNETLAKEYGWKEPIGQKLPGKYSQTVIGVIKDFNTEMLYTPVKPVVLTLDPADVFKSSTDVVSNYSSSPRISIRFKGNVQDNVAYLKSAWKKVAGDREFDNFFLDDTLATAYEQEKRLSKIVIYAAFLSIFISCMGLFGLATLVVVRRTKEIGIRKVLGADVSKIVTLLSKDFIVLVAIASLVAFPLAWWALQSWLQDFAYRIDVPWLAFIGAAVAALIVTLLTVSFQAIKAALMNPVKSLRTE
jgi:putative ABC transport system permease protein